MTPEVKPWEPVSSCWTHRCYPDQKTFKWHWFEGCCRKDAFEGGWRRRVTLANGQTIIVKAKEPNPA